MKFAEERFDSLEKKLGLRHSASRPTMWLHQVFKCARGESGVRSGGRIAFDGKRSQRRKTPIFRPGFNNSDLENPTIWGFNYCLVASAVIMVTTEPIMIPVIAMPLLAPVSLVAAVAVAISSVVVPIVIPIAIVALRVRTVRVSAITPVLLLGQGAASESNDQGCRC
jgi:hypothetical protein